MGNDSEEVRPQDGDVIPGNGKEPYDNMSGGQVLDNPSEGNRQ